MPAGFHGWAVLRFSVTGVPPLPVDGGALVAEYPASGRLETSAGPEAGFLHREYFCRTADGLAPLSRMSDVWGEYNQRVLADGPNAAITCSAGFFVGTLAEFRAAERPRADVEPPAPPSRAETPPP